MASARHLTQIDDLDARISRCSGALTFVAFTRDSDIVVVAVTAIVADKGGRALSLLALELLLDVGVASLTFTRATQKLPQLLSIQSRFVAVLERYGRRATLDDAFDLEVSCKMSAGSRRLRIWRAYCVCGI